MLRAQMAANHHEATSFLGKNGQRQIRTRERTVLRTCRETKKSHIKQNDMQVTNQYWAQFGRLAKS